MPTCRGSRIVKRPKKTAAAKAGGRVQRGKAASETSAEAYRHPEATSLARPEAGQQARFRKRKPKATYRYDNSLSPSMEWDENNPAREHGEWLIACIAEASKLTATDPPFTFAEPRHLTIADEKVVAEVRGLADATEQLQRLSRPFLNWAGKAERQWFDVPTLPLFVHERLATKAIIETLKSRCKDG